MQLSDFHYELPEELIARYPAKVRTGSRLMHMVGNTGQVSHLQFPDVESLLNSGDLLVLNNTRVIPARMLGQKATGGKVEVFIERVLPTHEAWAHIKASKSPKPGTVITCSKTEDGVTNSYELEVLGRAGELFHIASHGAPIFTVLEEIGHIPLPHYMSRDDEACDQERYQTVYSKHAGAVAAPTAGLHFDEALLSRLQQKGIDVVFVTLHVGAGTFQPVRTQDITQHQMHHEYLEVDASTIDKILSTKAGGGRVVAVGTTSVRAIETAASAGALQPYQGETNLFIYPGYEFKVIDAMITNFHLPESSLLMLVSAFSGYEQIKQAYQEAISAQYRFFSYGDAMFLERRDQ